MRRLTVSEICDLGREYQKLADWEVLRDLTREYYGEKAAFVVVETESEYNDEGGYDDYINQITVSDRDDAELIPDFSLSAWTEFLKEQEITDSTSYQEQFSAEGFDDYEVRDYLRDNFGWNIAAVSQRYDLTTQPLTSYQHIYVEES